MTNAQQRKRILRSLRAAQGLTQIDVADALQVQHHHYWRIENGYQEPEAGLVRRLAKLLKVTPEALPFALESRP